MASSSGQPPDKGKGKAPSPPPAEVKDKGAEDINKNLQKEATEKGFVPVKGKTKREAEDKTAQNKKPNVPQGNWKRPLQFKDIVVKDWYNTSLPDEDYAAINNLWKKLQQMRVSTPETNAYVSALEKIIKEKNRKIHESEKGYHRCKTIVENLLNKSSLIMSRAMKSQKQQLQDSLGSTSRNLRSILEEIEIKDLAVTKIDDFIELVNYFKFDIAKYQTQRKLKDMFDSYQRNLVDDQAMLAYFEKLKDDGISALFKSASQVILNQYDRPRVLVSFEQIPSHAEHIKKGIVHKLYVDKTRPEEYKSFIPEICSQALEDTGKFQRVFEFTIWAIWEERNLLEFYPSYQIWRIDPLVREPHFRHISFNEKEYDLEEEKEMSAVEFFESLHYNNGKMIIKDSTILYLPQLAFKEKELQEKVEEEMVIGPIAQRAKEQYEVMMSTGGTSPAPTSPVRDFDQDTTTAAETD